MKKPKELLGELKTHWKIPKEGNHVSISEFISWCAASMGFGGWASAFGWLSLSAGSATLCGLIFQIRWMDVYILGIIGTVLNYITLPLVPYIMDNMGRLSKKVTRALILGGIGCLALAGVLWVMPTKTSFYDVNGLLPDFFKHIALRLAVFVLTSALTAVLLRLFGGKFGKFKTFMVLYGVPLFALVLIMVNMPYKDMNYSRLLLMTDLITALISGLSVPYTNTDAIQNRLSPNSQERTRMMSVAPIFTGLLRSIFGIVFPMAAQLFGGIENIRTFKVILPIYCALCLAESLLILRVHERVIQEKGHVAQVKFTKAVKEIFSNKYQWIKSLSDVVGMGPNIQDGLVTWMFIYITRMPWIYGLMINLVKLPTSSTGQLSSPFFTKRFSKRQNIIGMRIICALLTVALLPAMRLPSGTGQIILLLVMCSIKIFFVSAHDVINRAIGADIWDYQQWKSGERLEASTGYFTYITGPLGTLIGYIMPFFMTRVGFLGDMDILYDPAVLDKVLLAQMAIAVGSMVLSSLPFLFYDLTPKKMEQIGSDLKARAEAAEAEQAPKALEGGELA